MKTIPTTIPNNIEKNENGFVRRPQELRLQQRKQISRLLTLGHTQAEIAELLELSEATISREVAKLREGFKQHVRQNIPELQANELARLEEIESAAWLKHQKSGSTEALNTALRCIQVRAGILGLDSPDGREFHRRAVQFRDGVFRAITETVTDPDLLLRIGQRLQEISMNIEPTSEATPAEIKNQAIRDSELSSPPRPEPVPQGRYAVRRRA